MKCKFVLLLTVLIVTVVVGGHSLWAEENGITTNTITFAKVMNEKEIPKSLQEMIQKQKRERGYAYCKNENGVIYLAIFAGEKRTGGYGIQVENVEDIEGITMVTVKETAPAKGAFVTMAITYPYTVVKFTGATENFHIVNQDGNSIGETGSQSSQIDSKKDKLLKELEKRSNQERLQTLKIVTDAWANRLTQLDKQLKEDTLAKVELQILQTERDFVWEEWKKSHDEMQIYLEKLESDC